MRCCSLLLALWLLVGTLSPVSGDRSGLSATVLLLVVGAFALLPVLLFLLLGRGVRTSTKTTSAQKG